MRTIYRLVLVLPFCLMASIASAQEHSNESCPTCKEINQCLSRLSLNPDSAADMDLSALVSRLDSIHLFDFVSRTTTALQPKITSTSPTVVRNYYLPFMVTSIKSMVSQNDMFTRMSMNRATIIDQYLSPDLSDDFVQALLNELCLLANYMTMYTKFLKDTDLAGHKNWFYNNLHYIERTLYGDDVFMQSLDPVPPDCYSRLYANFSNYITDFNQHADMLILSGIMSAYNIGQYKLLADNSRDIIAWALCVMPDFQRSTLGDVLRDAGRRVGREKEMEDVVYEETVNRYVDDIRLVDGIFTRAKLVNNFVDQEAFASFEEYRAVLQNKGYKFAECWPWNCPPEYVDDGNFDKYKEYCIESAKILRLYWIAVTFMEGSSWGNQFITAIADYFGCQSDEILTVTSLNYASMIYNGGYTAIALDIIEASLNHYRHLPITTFVPYALADIALIYVNLGNHAKASDIICDYFLQYINDCGFDNDFLYDDLMLTAKCAEVLGTVGKVDIATELADFAASMVDRIEADIDKADISWFLSGVYSANNDYNKAINLVEQCLHYDIPTDYKLWLELGLAELNYRLKNWSQAVDSYKRYVRLQRLDNTSVSPNFFSEIMSCAAHADDKECLQETAEQYVGNIRADIDDKLYNLSSEERERFYHSILDGNRLLDVYEASRDDQGRQSIFSACAYDYALVMKGLLLSADNRIDRMLTEHPDSLVRQRYLQMKDLSAQLDNMFVHGGDPNQLSFVRESLDMAHRDISTILRSERIEYNNAEYEHVGWRDIREKLGIHDVAIEFMRLYDGENDSVDPLYVALVLRKEWEFPRVVELCRESALLKYADGNQIRCRRLYNGHEVTNLWPLIWKPLEEYISDGESVYFAVDGILNMLNLGAIRDYAPDRRADTADERYVLRRLSSTKELCKGKTNQRIKGAVIYGGLNYDMGDEVWAEVVSKYDRAGLASSRELSRGSSKDGLLPDGDIYAQTFNEAVDVASMLREHNVTTNLITGNKGVEESFKSLSGKHFDLLHMATHGFYMSGQTEYQAGEELLPPMMRSGLMLSRKKVTSADDLEDGLLLAREIADMDLSSVDLVVLSACQTAQGDISGDSVFGLQRGFKQAGVGSIIMTLWEIDSEMAQYMTTEFYSNLIAGVEKHEAFRIAQSKTKQAFPNLDWAAFIMLD